LLGAVMTFRDASARHWEEKQLRQTQKLEAAARLAAGAANEYTSLVAGIRSQAERLLRQFAESSAPRAALEEIQTAAAAAESVTRRLAVFGSRQEVQPEAFSLNGVLRRMARLIESAAGSRIQVAMLPTPGSGQVLADAAQIESAILSLVHHACAAMPEGGQLLVETNRVELPRAGRAMEYVLLAIGYSTADPEIDRLFEAESVLDSGAGLALAAVHSAVVEAGGHISARLDGNGGSRIEMLLPRWSEEELLPRAGADSTEPSAVLLVDEREHVRADLHNFFEASGYNLLEASDAAEAIALGELHEGRLDLVVANLGDAQAIGRALSGSRPSLQVLSVVDRQESGAGEIQRPFTRQALLEKAAGLMGAPV
ncbi:MAG TPA: hypothetical protein VFW83_05115, partial [Bryobacteraceae bacterium]|nr:hypothetical protein [Bryobacteraceae bacterium]